MEQIANTVCISCLSRMTLDRFKLVVARLCCLKMVTMLTYDNVKNAMTKAPFIMTNVR